MAEDNLAGMSALDAALKHGQTISIFRENGNGYAGHEWVPMVTIDGCKSMLRMDQV